MLGCWAYDVVNRPNFSTLVTAIGENLAVNAEYLTFSVSSAIPSAALTLDEDSNNEQ